MRSLIFRAFIEKELKGLEPQIEGVVVDLGSNGGDKTGSLLRKFPKRKVIGIDIHNSSLERARKRYHRESRAEFGQGDARQLQEAVNESIAVVFASQIFHHFDAFDRLDALSSCISSLAPGGVFIISDTFMRTDSLLCGFGVSVYKKIARSDAYHNIPYHQMIEEVCEVGKMLSVELIPIRVHHLLSRTAQVTGLYPSTLLAFRKDFP